jgi:putative Mg2+ transporter-C (MgtC) family protein
VDQYELLWRVLAALTAGAVIGLERSYRGRAAGLRTYALVALGSSLLVASAEYAGGWAAIGTGDPTRVIQGIVTGIGFLGAGVIIREGFSVRGLTTAASIWVIAAIGTVFGAGLFRLGTAATIGTWVALELLRQLEGRIPVHSLVHCDIAFARASAWDEPRLRAVADAHGFNIGELSYTLDGPSQRVVYEVVMWSKDVDACSKLEQSLLAAPDVLGFRITPGRD